MNNLSITLKETLTLYSFFKKLLSIITLGNILFIGGYCIYIYNWIYMYMYIYIFVSASEIINIPCTQGDRIHIYIYKYVSQYDENLLNIFLVCCLKPSIVKSTSKYPPATREGGHRKIRNYCKCSPGIL